ncbi:inner nuclear membrane protein enriched at telomere/subtelomere region [Blyttiomyces sp. JEL0837]|nr:inner nuclear membrane protein enriched at telomere/subtelomere region [Blyttiomyces sp. JEL0837]
MLASSMDSLPDYLLDSWDPDAKTVNELVSALSDCGIDLPGKREKKQFYVDLFREEVEPYRTKMIAKIQAIKAKTPQKYSVADNVAQEKDGKRRPTFATATPGKQPVFKEPLPPVKVEPVESSAVSGSGSSTRQTRNANGSNEKRTASASAEAKNQQDVIVISDADEESSSAAGTKKGPRAMGDLSSKLNATPAKATESQRRGTAAGSASPLPFSFKAGTPNAKAAASTTTTTAAADKSVHVVNDDEDDDGPPLEKRKPARKPWQDAAGGDRRQTIAVPPSGQSRSLLDESPRASPGKFVDFQRLATPVKALPNFRDVRHRASAPGEAILVDNSADLTWDSLLPSTSLKTPSTVKDSPGRPSDASGKTSPVKIRRPAAVPRRAKRKSSFTSMIIKTFAVLLALALAIGYALVWDRVGYRDRGTPSPKWGLHENKALDDILSRVFPMTKECPVEALCSKKTVIACEKPDHVLHRSMLVNLAAQYFGPEIVQFVLPFGLGDPYCLPDTAKLQKEARKQIQVENLISLLDDIVRRWIGRAACGERQPDPPTPLELSIHKSERTKEIIGMPVSAGRRELRAFVGNKWTDEKFDDYWSLLLMRLAEGEVAQTGDAKPNLYTTVDDSGRHRLFVSKLPPIMSWSCSIQRNLWVQARTRWFELTMTGFALILGTAFYLRQRTQARDAVIVASLVEDILDSLYEESENHRVDPVRHPVSGLSVTQVRDHFLAVAVQKTAAQPGVGEAGVATTDGQGRTRWAVADDVTRNRIWKKTSAIILRNSSVRETIMELRGEQHTVWQWIGSHALSPRAKKTMDLGAGTGMPSTYTPKPANAPMGTGATGVQQAAWEIEDESPQPFRSPSKTAPLETTQQEQATEAPAPAKKSSLYPSFF